MIKLIAFWALFAITVFYNLDIKQVDVKIVFFYDIIDQVLYIEVSCRYKQE